MSEREFPWGSIQRSHEIGPYEIVEYIEDGETHFHPFIDGRDTNYSYPTLEDAMAGCIELRIAGPYCQYARMFMDALQVLGDARTEKNWFAAPSVEQQGAD